MYKPILSMLVWLLPATCILCGSLTRNTQNICHTCQQDLPILPHGCQQCADFLLSSATNDNLKCGNCLKNPPAYDKTYALFPYKPPINHLITKLKFNHQLSHARALGELMTNRIQSLWYVNKPLPDLIIPIPLHPLRLRERGFNQAIEIARPIAKALAIPIDFHGVTRIKHTRAQSGLPAKERKCNLTQAFSLSRNYSNLTVAVIDDVITTGHTVMECCRMIKDHGAKRIDVWCCARNG